MTHNAFSTQLKHKTTVIREKGGGGLTTLSELFNQVCEIVEVILVVVWGERTPGPPGQLRPALEVRGKEGEGPNISVEVI